MNKDCCLEEPGSTVYCLDCGTFDCKEYLDHHCIGCACTKIGDCESEECEACGILACGEPLHYHHDGCPNCSQL